MLSCCDADGEILSVPEFFAVGKTFRALFWCAVKGGGHCQFLNISVIYKVHLRRVPRPSVFINHLTLPSFLERYIPIISFLGENSNAYGYLVKQVRTPPVRPADGVVGCVYESFVPGGGLLWFGAAGEDKVCGARSRSVKCIALLSSAGPR